MMDTRRKVTSITEQDSEGITEKVEEVIEEIDQQPMILNVHFLNAENLVLGMVMPVIIITSAAITSAVVNMFRNLF